MIGTLYLKKGDTGQSFSDTLAINGVALNLTGGSVKFIMVNKATGAVKVNAAAAIVTPASGLVRYDWGASDVNTPGNYHGEWEVTLSGKTTSLPLNGYIEIVIGPDLA